MERSYEKPELTFVGKADDVVFGVLIVGSDIADEFVVQDAEFQADR